MGRNIGAGIVGAFMLLGITLNLMAFPHPTWMAAAGVVGAIAATWPGMRVSRQTAAAA